MSSEPKTEEEKDAEELREVEQRLEEVLQLMTSRRNRKETDAALERARIARSEHTGDVTPVFHVTAQHHVPTTMHTKRTLDLCEQLKMRIQLGQYALELDDTLHRLSERYAKVLEKILARSKY